VLTASGSLLERIARDHMELRSVLTEPTAISLSADAGTSMRALFQGLAAEFKSNLPARRTAAEALVTGILVGALRRKLQLGFEAERSSLGADSILASKYRTLIEENFRKPIKISDYAQRLFVSSERLRQACVSSTASSPLVLLNARRLLEAKRNLIYTNMSIALIAEASGFPDPAYFSRFFTQRTGLSPLAYRNKQQRGSSPLS
jgi:AraC family transcriptional regulator, transcriptional activator of pobA